MYRAELDPTQSSSEVPEGPAQKERSALFEHVEVLWPREYGMICVPTFIEPERVAPQLGIASATRDQSRAFKVEKESVEEISIDAQGEHDDTTYIITRYVKLETPGENLGKEIKIRLNARGKIEFAQKFGDVPTKRSVGMRWMSVQNSEIAETIQMAADLLIEVKQIGAMQAVLEKYHQEQQENVDNSISAGEIEES